MNSATMGAFTMAPSPTIDFMVKAGVFSPENLRNANSTRGNVYIDVHD
jgi:hypothetical protein